jgi:hypothetical protein
MKFPDGMAFALLGSVVPPIPARKVPETVAKSPVFDGACGETR